ncbi:MAG: hypothetical protein CMQ20_03110 [Gammaproteobacteria bacterium]|jgi:pyruvate-ferredoxin/flavodoxin oxidoreductase|nr:hypothetical protein [Gammaproteobacteria bacterium]|tara:strand:+ start:9487 stop:13992 length:4506 start_codon:yes stop_codon:yes gene_type:complete
MVDLTNMAVRLYRKYISDDRSDAEEEIRVLLTGDQAVAVVEASVCETAVLGGNDELKETWLEQIDQNGLNVFNQCLTSVQGNSARSAVASATGLSLAGKRATTFITGQNVGAVQDLLFTASGRHLPLVVHLTNLAMPGHGIASGSGHEGFHLSADSGFFTLFAENVQQAADFSFIARRVAEVALVPGLVVMDADETARSVQDVSILSPLQIQQFIGATDEKVVTPTAAQKLLFGENRLALPRWHDVDRPVVAGAFFDSQSYYTGATGKSLYFDDGLDEILSRTFEDFARLSGRQYHAVSSHGSEKADTLYVVQGAASETVASASTLMRGAGIVSIVSLRPFPDQLLMQHLKGKSNVIVLERLLPPPGVDSPLMAEVRQSLERAFEGPGGKKQMPMLHSVRYGLGGAPLRVADLALVASSLDKDKSSTIDLGIEFGADASHPKRQALLDEITRAYPQAVTAGLKAKELANENAGEGTVSVAVQRVFADGYQHIIPGVAGILHQVENGTVRTRAAFSEAASSQEQWRQPGVDSLLHSTGAVVDAGDDAALDIVCIPLKREGTIESIDISLLQRLRAGGIIVVGSVSPDQLSRLFREAHRDLVNSKSVHVYSAPVAESVSQQDVTETMIGAIFCAIINASVLPLKDRKVLSSRENALRFEPTIDRESRLQSFKNGLESIEEVDLSQVPVTSGDSLGDKSAPVILQRLAARDDQFDSLPRFWNQTGILYREKQVDRIVSDPYLASGTIAPLSATFRDFAGKRTTIPQVDADKCTGCGRCWETCPDSSIAPLVISPSDLIDHGIREAGADSLRQLANQLNSRILSQARKQELAGDVGSILRETYDWLSGKMEQTPERQQAVEEALDLVCNKIGSLPVSVTQEFFDNAESNSKDSGEFLVLAINPDTCKDCGLCERVCDAEAITFAPQVDENINAARLVWDIWSAMPDTRSDTISRVIESPEFSNMAAINLSRYCLLSMAGGDGAESGSGEKVALRMILSATEFNQQPIVRRFIDQLADTSEEIVNEIRELLAISLPAEDLDLLSQGMDSIRAPLVELSELAKKVEASMDVTPVDAVRLNRLLEVASRLTDLHWRFSSGRQGLGRARFGMAMAPGTVAGWAASFPYNVFQSPVVLDFANETPQMAAGLLEGHLRDTCESVALLRAARLEIEQPAGLQFALDSLSHLKWQDLTEEERQICPPMLVIGDDNTFGGEALAQVLWALGSDLPVKIVAFSDLDISGSQGTKDSQTNMAMLAITGRTSFVTQTSIADAGHMYSSITQAIQHLGPALVRIHGASPSRHGFGSSQTIEAAYQAVRSRTFPLFTYNPGAEGVHGMRLDLTGNESLAGIWGDDEQPYTPAHWAATEQRFSHHFKPMDEDEVNGVAVHEFIELNERARKGKIAFVSVPKGETETRLAVDDLVIDATELARDNWRVMQELAGIVTPFTGHVEEEVRKQVQAEHDAEIASIREEYEQQISELDASIRSDVAGRVRSQLLRLVNSGSSNTE